MTENLGMYNNRQVFNNLLYVIILKKIHLSRAYSQ